MTLFEAYKKVATEIWDAMEGDDVVQLSLTFSVIFLTTAIVVTMVAFFPDALLTIVSILAIAGVAMIVLYGPIVLIYRTLRLYLRHDNPDEEESNDQGLGS